MQFKQITPYLSIQAAIVTASVCLVIFILVFFRSDDRINQSNLDYASACGIQIEAVPTDVAHIAIPESFDSVFSAYNSIISEGGFDLSAYRGERAVRYSYRVLNCPSSDSGLIRVNIIVCKNNIIAADISSPEPGGFIRVLAVQ